MFFKDPLVFSCVIISTINANYVTIPLPLQFHGTAQAPDGGSVGGATQSCHPVLWYRGSGNLAGSFVDQDCDGWQCLQHKFSSGFLVWVTLPAVFFILNSLLGFPSVFLFPPALLYPSNATFNCRMPAVNNGCHVFQVLKGHKHRRVSWNSWVKRLVQDAICVLNPIHRHVKRQQIFL